MAALAEVIDESIRNMTSNMVTKAEQEKVLKLSVAPAPPEPHGVSSNITRSRSTLRSSSRSCS